jgi:hypothetical protein
MAPGIFQRVWKAGKALIWPSLRRARLACPLYHRLFDVLEWAREGFQGDNEAAFLELAHEATR